MTTCLNCNYTFEGNFCNQCGQKASTKRMTVKGVLHDLPHNIFHVDKGVLKNITGLRNPRKAVFDYLEGRKVGFFNPFLFFLITTGLILFIEHLFHKELDLEFDLQMEDGAINASEFLNKYLKYIYFGTCFLYALPTYLIFRKSSGLNYAEQITANVFILGYVNIVYLLLILFPFAGSFPANPIAIAAQLVFLALVFHRKNLALTIIKSLVSLAFQIFLFFLLCFLTGIIVGVVKSLSE